MRALLILGFSVQLACGVNQTPLIAQQDAQAPTVDSASIIDAAPIVDAAPDAKVCANGRVLFLNFDGVTLTTAATSDARVNQINWNATNVVVPPYLAGQANRATMITDVTTKTRAILAMFPVTVVTTRPTSGEYIMIAFGGNGSLFGFPSNTPAVTGYNCGGTMRNGVGWVADGNTAQQAANVVVGATGISLGLTGVVENLATDCLCGWGGAACTPNIAQACTLATAVMRNTAVCPGDPAMQNEVAAFENGFCKP
ncbi:MAG TPA: hypothetical protein PLF40_09510 [Kofleriaceae bacterium]|nr:hypothetical protein [Kofleriaceae bacterium]